MTHLNLLRKQDRTLVLQVTANRQTFLLHTNEVCEGYVFTPVCQSFCSQGGMHGCRGVCMVVEGGGMYGCRGHAWLQGGMCGCKGVCMVARGGMHGCGGHAWLWGCGWLLGSCMVVGGVLGCGGHAWLWGAYMVVGWGVAGGACLGYDKIRSMSGQYASYWNAFLLQNRLTSGAVILFCNKNTMCYSLTGVVITFCNFNIQYLVSSDHTTTHKQILRIRLKFVNVITFNSNKSYPAVLALHL